MKKSFLATSLACGLGLAGTAHALQVQVDGQTLDGADVSTVTVNAATDTVEIITSDGSTQIGVVDGSSGDGSTGGTNNVPSASNDSVSTTEGTAVSGDVSSNDSGLGDTPVTFSITGEPSNGSVSMNGDGTFTYTPASGYTGTDTFNYSVSDSDNDSDTAAVTVTVNANDDTAGGSCEELAPDDVVCTDAWTWPEGESRASVTIPQGQTLSTPFTTTESTSLWGKIAFEARSDTTPNTDIWFSTTPGGKPYVGDGTNNQYYCKQMGRSFMYSLVWSQFDTSQSCTLELGKQYYFNIRHSSDSTPQSYTHRWRAYDE